MADEGSSSFRVPPDIGKYAAIVADDFARSGKELLRDILISASLSVEEAVFYDSWGDRDLSEHALHLVVPPDVYVRIGLDNLEAVGRSIADRLNLAIQIPDESIRYVTIEASEAPSVGLPFPTSSRDAQADLWGDSEFLRLFISHKGEDKGLATDLKARCDPWGISCFVAHEDIEPTKEWQTEIERGLRSMDAMAALLTPAFHASRWTDQEVGVAIGRGVPVLPVRLGEDPYGFIGKYQAMPGLGVGTPQLARRIQESLLTGFAATELRMKRALVSRFEQATSYAHTKALMGVLATLTALPQDLVDRLQAAPSANSQVRGSWAVERLPQILERLGRSGPPE